MAFWLSNKQPTMVGKLSHNHNNDQKETSKISTISAELNKKEEKENC
jgi:hypothetical protein